MSKLICIVVMLSLVTNSVAFAMPGQGDRLAVARFRDSDSDSDSDDEKQNPAFLPPVQMGSNPQQPLREVLDDPFHEEINGQFFTETLYRMTCGQVYTVNGFSLPEYHLAETCADYSEIPEVSTLVVKAGGTNHCCSRGENVAVPQASDKYFKGIRILQYDEDRKVVSWAVVAMIENRLSLDIYDENNNLIFKIEEKNGSHHPELLFSIVNSRGKVVARAKRAKTERGGKARIVFTANSRVAGSYDYLHEDFINSSTKEIQSTTPSIAALLKIRGPNDQIDIRAVQFLPVGLDLKVRMLQKALVAASAANQRWRTAKQLSWKATIFAGTLGLGVCILAVRCLMALPELHRQNLEEERKKKELREAEEEKAWNKNIRYEDRQHELRLREYIYEDREHMLEDRADMLETRRIMNRERNRLLSGQNQSQLSMRGFSLDELKGLFQEQQNRIEGNGASSNSLQIELLDD